MNYRPVFTATLQTAGLFIAGFVIPLLGQALALFTPVPLILVFVREGRREGLMTLLAAGVIIGVLGGWQSAALLAFSFGLMAIGVSEGMRRRMKPEQVALLGGLLPVAALGLVLAFYLARTGRNPFTAAEEYLRSGITDAAKFYTDLGLKEMADAVNAASDAFIHYLVRLSPGITVATSVAQAACCYGLSRAVITRKTGETATAQASFSAWHAPDSWVWGLIAALAFIVVPRETVRIAGWNLAIVFATVYLAQGAAIVEHYLKKARLRAFARGMILALLLVMPPAVAGIIALGIVDIWADVRKVRGQVKA